MRGKSLGVKCPPPLGSVHSTGLCKQKARGQQPHAASCPQNKAGFANTTSLQPGESFAETQEFCWGCCQIILYRAASSTLLERVSVT